MNENYAMLMLASMSDTENIPAEKNEQQAGPNTLWKEICFRMAGRSLLVVFVVGLLVRWTVRDSQEIIGAIYYALPWPLLGAMVFAAAYFYRMLSQRTLSRWLTAIGAVCIFGWGISTWQVSVATQSNIGTVRIIFWNTCRGWGGWDGLARELNTHQADIIGLVESGLSHQQIAERWKPHFADQTVRYLGRGMTIITRGEIGEIQDHTLAQGSHAYSVSVMLDGRENLVVICDICSTPWRSRSEPLQQLAKIVAAPTDKPVILMGDFNTPIDSLHLKPLQQKLMNVFGHAGNGMHVTWPLPLPVLALDQIWVNDRFQIQSAQLGWSWRSDHRLVMTDLQPNFDSQSKQQHQPLQPNQP